MSVFSQQGIAPSKWLCPIICGSFGVSTVYAPLKAQIGIVSRVSTLRPGTRFNTRGVDDNGFVANFVETESVCLSHMWYNISACYILLVRRIEVLMFGDCYI